MEAVKQVEFLRDAAVGLGSAAFALLGAAVALGGKNLLGGLLPKGGMGSLFSGPGMKGFMSRFIPNIPKAGTAGNAVIGESGKKLYGAAAQNALRAGTGKESIGLLGKLGARAGAASTGGILAGLFGAFEGFTTSMDKQQAAIDKYTAEVMEDASLTEQQKKEKIDLFAKENEVSKTKAAGAAGVQGGFAAGGAILGGILGSFAGPVGTMIGGAIGGFIGDKVGGYLNEKAPWLANAVSQFFSPFVNAWNNLKVVFASVMDKFSGIGDAVGSLVATIGGWFGEGSEGGKGLGTVFNILGTIISGAVMTPLNIIIAAFGFLADGIKFVINVINGLLTMLTSPSQGLVIIKDAFVNLFEGLKDFLKNAFGGLWNSLLDMLPQWDVVKNMRVEMPGKKVQEEKQKQADTTSMLSRMASTVDDKGIIQNKNSQFYGKKWTEYVKQAGITEEQLKGIQVGKKTPTSQEVTSIASQIDQASAQALTASIQENVQVQKYASKLNEENKKNLEAINKNTATLVELTKAMTLLANAQYQYSTSGTAVKLTVDGKTLSNAMVKYENNNKAGKKPGT
jgi:hypothetical protein